MVSRDLATIVEGKNWVVQTSKNQSLITRNYHALQEIRDKYEHAQLSMDLKNFFVYKDSDAAKKYEPVCEPLHGCEFATVLIPLSVCIAFAYVCKAAMV